MENLKKQIIERLDYKKKILLINNKEQIKEILLLIKKSKKQDNQANNKYLVKANSLWEKLSKITEKTLKSSLYWEEYEESFLEDIVTGKITIDNLLELEVNQEEKEYESMIESDTEYLLKTIKAENETKESIKTNINKFLENYNSNYKKVLFLDQLVNFIENIESYIIDKGEYKLLNINLNSQQKTDKFLLILEQFYNDKTKEISWHENIENYFININKKIEVDMLQKTKIYEHLDYLENYKNGEEYLKYLESIYVKPAFVEEGTNIYIDQDGYETNIDIEALNNFYKVKEIDIFEHENKFEKELDVLDIIQNSPAWNDENIESDENVVTFLENVTETIEKNILENTNEITKIHQHYLNQNKNDIIKLHFNIDVDNKTFNLNGTSTIQEFKEIMDKLNNDERAHMQKELRKQFNSHLKLFAPQKLNIIPPIDKDISLKEKTWKEKYYDLKQEFDDFKYEVKDLITELKLEIKELREENKILKDEIKELKEKVNYYDLKYNNEYDKMKSKGNLDIGR